MLRFLLPTTYIHLDLDLLGVGSVLKTMLDSKAKKKNKKKIGSNVDNLRNLEPQPEQTFLIK